MTKYYFAFLVLVFSCKAQEAIVTSAPAEPLASMSQTEKAATRVSNAVEQTDIKSMLTFLASDALKGRDTGSDGLQAAAAYIISQFVACGISPMVAIGGYRQEVPFRTFSPPDSTHLIVNGVTLSFPRDYIVINGKEMNSDAATVFVGNGNPDEIDGQDLNSKIAVSIAGDGIAQHPRDWIKISADKRERLSQAGAIGLIEIYQNTSVPWRFLSSFGTQKQMTLDEIGNNNDMPTVWMGSTDSLVLASLKNNEGPIDFYMDRVGRKIFNSPNVVGYLEGSDPILKNEYIVYSAHYDHVGIGNADAQGDTIYNGTRDNAIGTTAVIQLAKYFSKNTPKRSSIFVLFTAEEKGLLGSRWFTQHLPVETEKIKFNFNIDNGGYNDTSIVTVIGLTRTTAEDKILDASQAIGLEAIEDPAKEQGLFDRSDNVNFAVLGIPAPSFSLGFRSFDAEIFKYYHQPGDEIETIDLDYIEKYIESYILSAEQIANDPIPPFWNEGDKYYKAGKDLYGLD